MRKSVHNRGLTLSTAGRPWTSPPTKRQTDRQMDLLMSSQELHLSSSGNAAPPLHSQNKTPKNGSPQNQNINPLTPLLTWCCDVEYWQQKSQNHNTAVGRVTTHWIRHCPVPPSLEHPQGVISSHILIYRLYISCGFCFLCVATFYSTEYLNWT